VTSAPPHVVLAGATATGKTGLSIRLAEWLIAQGRPAEIVSADSRQVFRGLDIGTAKVSRPDRARVPHHGLDLVDPDSPFSVAEYATNVRAALAGIAERGGVALLVGGTGLYLRTIGRGIATEALPSDAAVRARIEAELVSDGLPALAARLQAVAPTLADRHPRQVDRRPGARAVRERPHRRSSGPPRAVRPDAPGVLGDRLPGGLGADRRLPDPG